MVKLLGAVGFLPEAGISDILSGATTTLTQMLSMMTSVLTWVVGEPLILFMIGVGFAGVAIRWAKAMIHTN